ncbi:CDP-diacylglycerol-inositol 3-phosphatidyltransferase [Nowakowskiella sp. JEL0078]|nr:CDP-diacylglycerol-inositol 3-phosphatidyltransferase [Nowakowskiella sp. JEL0078]
MAGHPKQQINSTDVFLFVPNLIGYSRVILGVVGLYLLPTRPLVAMLCYSISALLDAVDGLAARHFHQATQFGSVLDMVTDRSTTSCLLVYLAVQHPAHALIFQLLIALDLSSHYMHMYMSLTQGAKSHKSLSEKDHWLLRTYYNNNKVLFVVCAGDQLFFIALYLLGWAAQRRRLVDLGDGGGLVELEMLEAGLGIVRMIWWVSLPVCVLKQFLNVVQLVRASVGLAKDDARQYQIQKRK